jgi:hypothetical protein
MSGHVFHPGHEELHGITVVLRDRSGRTYVGRYHERGPRGVVLHDVAIHDPAASEQDATSWLARQQKFGIQIASRQVIVPTEDTDSVRRLSEVR